MSLRLGVLLLVGCGTSHSDPPAFPANYAETYTEVRNCRFSVDHNQLNVRVLASPDALVPYRDRALPFPTGSIVLKEEYATSDTACEGSIVDYTVMARLPTGSAPSDLDWSWERVSASREVQPDDIMTCVRCHTNCKMQGVGYMGTCEEP